MRPSTKSLDVQRVLRPALPRLSVETGVDATMAGPVAPGGRRLVVTDLHGTLTSTMMGLVAAPGVGIGGKALQLGRPAVVNDYLNSSAVSHHFDHKERLEHVYAAVAVPVRVGRDTHAVLYGFTRARQPLGDRVLVAASRIAGAVGRELAVEIEVARRLAAIDDERRRRERRMPTAPDAEEIYDELVAITSLTTDPRLRDRLIHLCGRIRPPGAPAGANLPLLTGRECDVLAAVSVGCTNQEVADQLSIMPTTVKTYLKNVMRKLGTRNRVETIDAARRAGLL